MSYPVVRQLVADGIPVATACRVLQVSTSGYYDWRDRPASGRDWADAHLANEIRTIHTDSHGTYGARRVHAELRLGKGVRTSRKRVERLMRCVGRQGMTRRRRRGCTRRDPAAAPSEDLVHRRFTVTGPDRLWCADITQHRTEAGWLYLAVVLNAFSRRVVGWAMADQRISIEVAAQLSVAAGSGIDFVATDQIQAAAQRAGLDAATTEALGASYQDAQLQSLKAGLLAAAVLALVSLAFTRELPHAPPSSQEKPADVVAVA